MEEYARALVLKMENKRQNKRKRQSGYGLTQEREATISIDLIFSPPLPRNSYCLRSKTRAKNCGREGEAKRVSGSRSSPPSRPIKSSHNDEVDLKNKKPIRKVKFKPKVMANSPTTKTPEPMTPSPSRGRRGDSSVKSCRRGLDFASNVSIGARGDPKEAYVHNPNEPKPMLGHSRGGFCFTHGVRKSMEGHQEKSGREGGEVKRVSGSRSSPPSEPIKSSHNDEVDLKNKKPIRKVKFKPKVMANSPTTRTPEPMAPSPSCGWRGDSSVKSCRRGLDFASYVSIGAIGDPKEANVHDPNQPKPMLVYTRGGFCFTRRVRKGMEGHQEKKGLLMECNDKEEDKRWKNEQELFQQRAMSFITSMRLVQGNRPFMGWKGSVVDSVVGVFLTQNAGDNSSSSAFMSLAAKYPKENIIGDPKNDNHTEHALDWNAVRCAEADEISRVIQERGMNNRIAARIQIFLDSIYDEKSGLLDLEWLRKGKPAKAMEFFSRIYGLGLKSMDCLRLLTLRQRAFPVDRHVIRIVVRLGWVPIEKLPDGVLMHQLEDYPTMKSVQEYLSQRLCNLDVETLYELHYQMITFGKVFCTKKKPNCNSCPLKKDCKHFASAFASSRFSQLGSPGENTFIRVTPDGSTDPTTPVIHCSQSGRMGNKYEPVSSISPSPGRNIKVRLEEDIEDLCLGPEIHPVTIKTQELMKNVWNYMGEKNIPLKKDDVSRALITLSAEEAFSPIHKLKNAGRLRTEHQVYELPDSHPLVQRLDKRDRDDRNPYLLAIWPPGETENPSRLPKEDCSSQKSSEPGNADSQEEETVLGTFLVPCRTATRGSFPLDGTFFQINEVFADDVSSQKPLVVPRKLLWDLTRKTLLCGTSISAIFEGLSSQEIQECFWKGYVCIRGFNMKTRAPKPLPQQFHHALGKTVKIYRKGKSTRKRTSMMPTKDDGPNK